MGNLATCLIELENPDAVDFARKQLALDLEVYGPGHAAVAAAYDVLATALDQNDEPDDATAAGRAAVAIAAQSLGRHHPTTLLYSESWSADPDA